MPRTPLLQPTFHVTSTRRDFTFGDRLPSAVGKPAGFAFRIALRLAICRAASDAGPPCGHPASDSHALDGAPLASGRPTLPPLDGHSRADARCFTGRGGGERRGLFSRTLLCRIEPSDVSFSGGSLQVQKHPLPAAGPRSRQRHVNVHRRSGARRRLPPQETPPTSLSRADVERCPAGQRRLRRRT
jgi:hypothetical protein